MNYVKFYPSLIENLEKRYDHNFFYDNKEELRELIEELLDARYKVIELERFNKLESLTNFRTSPFIYCYLDSETEILEIVKVSSKFFEYIDMKKSESTVYQRTLINTVLRKRKGFFLPKISLRRLEYLLDCDLKRYIIKSGLTKAYYEIEHTLTKEEQEDIIYRILRLMSTKYNFGYKLDYETRSFTLNKDNKSMDFYWNEDGVLQDKLSMGSMVDSIQDISKKLIKMWNRKSK